MKKRGKKSHRPQPKPGQKTTVKSSIASKQPQKAAASAPREISDIEGRLWLARIKQVVLEEILHTPRQVLLERGERGMPRNLDGTYDLLAVTRWLKERGNGIYEKPPKATTAEGGDPTLTSQYEALDTKYKALERERKYREAAGDLMPKAEAERKYLAIVMQLRASLLAQPEALAAQLSNLPPRDVAKALDQQMRWLCQQFEQGWVPLTPDLVAAIDALVAKTIAVVIPVPMPEQQQTIPITSAPDAEPVGAAAGAPPAAGGAP